MASKDAGMLRRLILVLTFCVSAYDPVVALAADVTDATGRVVQVPDHIAHMVPAGPPAAILLEAIAPDLMAGWPGPLSDAAKAMLPPEAARLPRIPRLTGRADVSDKIKALHPDLILDYGNVTPRYVELDRAIRQKTGIPTLLHVGTLEQIPDVIRKVGVVLHREARAETPAMFAEALLTLPPAYSAHPTVHYARGAGGLTVSGPDTPVTEVFTRLGWKVLAPDGQGTFRTAIVDAIRTLDPDILIFSDPAMRDTLAHNGAWRTVRAVCEGHVRFAPTLPFGWDEEPPSINRLLGLAGHEPATIAATFNAAVYGRPLTPAQLEIVLAGARTIPP